MSYSRNNWIRFFVSFLIILLLLILPVLGAQVKAEVLMDGDSIFVETGSFWEFNQGYVFVIKDVNADGGVWVELSLDGVSLKDEVLYEGDIFVYSRDSTELFNMTVDTIYYGSGGDLVTFKPVFQYRDRSLPAPIPEDSEVSVNDSNTSSEPDVTSDNDIPGFGLITTMCCMVLVFICRSFFEVK
ncbi:S-layer protein domain-containing protein [Methanococcoides methylutens]|uniref:S-layer protein domain-containing protein n=1 Tax=Methanococcoides methylutens TaxID=2226 RepID=UPI0006947CD3|nr:S-layer protein domain-containing protein [Methanococcoides methylutens]